MGPCEAGLGAQFGLLRVIKPVRGAPSLLLYVDPVRLAAEPSPVLCFEPESYVGKATETFGSPGA